MRTVRRNRVRVPRDKSWNDLRRRLPPRALEAAGKSVMLVKVPPAAGDARHSARAKTYRYRIYREAICPPFLARYVWHYPYPLAEEEMARSAPLVAGVAMGMGAMMAVMLTLPLSSVLVVSLLLGSDAAAAMPLVIVAVAVAYVAAARLTPAPAAPPRCRPSRSCRPADAPAPPRERSRGRNVRR